MNQHAWPPSKDKFVRRCRAITERITEETSEIEGEWLTESDMYKMNFSEYLGFNDVYMLSQS